MESKKKSKSLLGRLTLGGAHSRSNVSASASASKDSSHVHNVKLRSPIRWKPRHTRNVVPRNQEESFREAPTSGPAAISSLVLTDDCKEKKQMQDFRNATKEHRDDHVMNKNRVFGEERVESKEGASNKSTLFLKETAAPRRLCDGSGDAAPPTFFELLNLRPSQIQSLIDGSFFYLKRRKNGTSMYDFEVVSHREASSRHSYFTLSKNGLSHFRDNDEVIFTTLKDLELEFAIHRKIKRITFFKNFDKWKIFYSWKRAMNTRKRNEVVSSLKSKLFFFDFKLQKPLMQMFNMCGVIRATKIIDVDPSHTYTIAEFQKVQDERRKDVQQQISLFVDKIVKLLRTACDEVLDVFILRNKIDAEHRLTFMERASLRKECKKLKRFIRLADFIIMDTMRSMALDSVHSFLECICPKVLPAHTVYITEEEVKQSKRVVIASKQRSGDQPASCLFALEVGFDASGTLKLQPDLDTMSLCIGDIIRNAVQTITVKSSMSEQEDFLPYTAAAADDVSSGSKEEGDRHDLATQVLTGVSFENCMMKINEGISRAYGKVASYCKIFEPFNKIYTENESIRHDMFKLYRDISLREINDMIEKFRSQGQSFGGIPMYSDVGIIMVDSSELKRRLLPNPANCLEALKVLLPEIVMYLSKTLMDQLQEFNPSLAAKNRSVEDFVRKLEVMEEVNKMMPEITRLFERQANVELIIRESEWSISDDMKAATVMLQESMSQLQQNMQRCESSVDDEKTRFVKKVNGTMPALQKGMKSLQDLLQDPCISRKDEEVHRVISFLHACRDDFEAKKSEVARFQGYQQTLGEAITDFEIIDDVAVELESKIKLWEGLQTWKGMIVKWKSDPFDTVDANSIGQQVKLHAKTAMVATRTMPSNEVCEVYRNMVTDFEKLIPIIEGLRNPAMRTRHWKMIEKLLGFDVCGKKDMTLGFLITNNVMRYSEDIEKISNTAIQEHVLEELFQKKIVAVWANMSFTTLPFKESKDVFILGGVDEVIASLDDSLVTANTILGSRYCSHIRLEVTKYQRNLVLIQETLEEWLMCQKQWMYLESIFSAADIQRQLPKESKMFLGVDKGWKEIMADTDAMPNCLRCGTVSGRREKFRLFNNTLDKIQKSLEDYLETKRQAFGRFYFISNDELLAILARARDPHSVQPFLRKCFDALVALEFGKGHKSMDILAMISPKGERVGLGRNLKARGPVEEWLKTVEDSMKKSLRKAMKEGVLDYDKRPRTKWVKMHPGQVIMCGAQIHWSRNTIKAITAYGEGNSSALDDWYEANKLIVKDLTAVVRQKISKLERRVIVALVTTDVHARDIAETIATSKVDSLSNFTWQQQLRYYWEPDVDDCVVRQSNAMFRYGYEYMGCSSRLVITPLTDRCWMTITGAIHLKLGASPAGPAGTGKTESTKDLAKGLGMFCIVFNCSDQIDYKMMAKLFAGLAQCGLWTCLDEFNRIQIEVLSVVAQQLFTLRGAILGNMDICHFEGRKIKVQVFSVNVTMNPGYAGRTELPDNLKVFFRPVAMMIPDYALIAEIMLFAEGFEDSRNLATKMIKMYKLSSEQLSQQPHYDYGLRAVKSVLVMAGELKRSNPELGEDIVLIRALRDSNVPKFLKEDIELYMAILQDLFPGVDVPYNETGTLQDAIESEIDKAGLQRVPAFIKKTVQLFETFNVRFGVCMVGPTTSGKTRSYQVLQSAMTRLCESGESDERYQRVFTHVLNPKSISMGELYGEFNELTAEWTDGLASTIMRTQANDETENRQWVVFDGPVDTLWIESMNTVLDDNMTLCLANGERIKLRPQMRMLFECMHLTEASPATVSRIGVVYYSQSTIGVLPVIKSWWQRTFPAEDNDVPASVRGRILELFETTLEDGLRFQRRNLLEPVKTCDIQIANSVMIVFTSLWNYHLEKMLRLKLSEEKMMVAVEMFFAYAYVWGVGGCTNEESMEKFNDWITGKTKIELFSKLRWLGGTATVFDGWVDIDEKTGVATFRPWKDIMPEFKYATKTPFFQLVVPTLDTVRFSYLMRRNLEQHGHMFFTGLTGTGKTVIVNDVLRKMAGSTDSGGMDLHAINLNFSARTRSLQTQMTIEDKLEKKRKTLLGPPGSKKIVAIFVDDVNMPTVEEYGAQPPIELLRQIVGFGGVYDREKLYWKDIQNMAMFLAAAPPGGGRSPITERVKSMFHTVCVPQATEAVLESIFGTIYTAYVAGFKFSSDIAGMAKTIVNETIRIYNEIALELRPTPAKSHYTFNLRDVSKVFQGIMMGRPRQIKDAATSVKLWMHETMRVFHDRLVNKDDKRWFTEQIVRSLKKFGVSWTHEELFESGDPTFFCDFLKPGVKNYSMVRSAASVRNVLQNYLEDYNMTFPARMDLVFFTDAIKHITRISRILRQPRGNAMLVGVGGSGKQSSTRIAAFIGEVDCFQIELVRGYGSAEFREDIKSQMVKSGVEGKPTCFLFCDTQIVDESFVEDINNILNTGEITGLFENDEVNKICEDLRPVAEKQGIVGGRDTLWQFFVSRVRDNLHIVLAMSPVGDALRVRFRQFPSLINCTTVDWYTAWPEDALLSVAKSVLSQAEIGEDDLESKLVEFCAAIPGKVDEASDQFFAELRRKVYNTPKSYLDMISLYIKMLNERKKEMLEAKMRLATGVRKIEESKSVVSALEVELTKLQPVLDRKSVETAELLKVVAVQETEAKAVRENVAKEAKVVEAQQASVLVIQQDAEKDLAKALPALRGAVKALDALRKDDINEIKSFPKPPPAVRMVMEGVCLLLGEPLTWEAAKKTLMKGGFLQMLKGYDKDNIPAKMLKKLRKYTKNPDMAVEAVAKVSVAAKSICMWLHAMDVYSVVAKEVEPKKKKLALMNEKLKAANDKLAEKQAQLKGVEDKVKALQEKLQATLDEKKRLEDESARTASRLDNAEKLTSLLADEYVRWKANVEEMDVLVLNLIGDVFVSAGCVSYLGPFTGVYRENIVEEWVRVCKDLKIPCSASPTLINVMGDPMTTKEWQMNGLPTDAVSTNNAIMFSRCERWPLCIDPQEQAKKWINNTYSDANLEVTRLTDPNLLRTLEMAIRSGNPLLLEDIGETLDPALEPVLLKAVFKQSGRTLIHIGDSDIDYNPDFRFMMTTKLPNPHYLPEICIKVTIINFTVTFEGLEDQLLGKVVEHEAPAVQRQSEELVASIAGDQKKMRDIESEILRLLSESEGNILDDVVLIKTLEDSKVVSKQIKERLQASEVTSKKITELRNKYRPVASRGSIIYFVIADMAEIDPMYQYSLEYFLKLFRLSLKNAKKDDDIDKRLDLVKTYLTEFSYANVCRGLFSRHEVLFSFQLCAKIFIRSGAITSLQFLTFLRGAGMEVNPSLPPPKGVSENCWNMCYVLEKDFKDTFDGFCTQVKENASAWIEWAGSDNPNQVEMPGGWSKNVSAFEKVLIVKAFCEEKLIFACKDLVRELMGEFFTKSPSKFMDAVFDDTDPLTPIVFILSTGADPTDEITAFAKVKGMYPEKFRVVALGQGQGPRAEKAIEDSIKTGGWVMLQNCHLGKSWLPKLESICESMHKRDLIHDDYRLFLTSMPAKYFPIPILQNGVKLTTEPPKGLRQNLKRSLDNVGGWTDFDDIEARVERPWNKIVFGAAFFHATVQERRSFGALGFNIPYEFNDTDLSAAVQITRMFLTEQPVIPWQALLYLIGQITYGGRVTDDWDRRCLMSILRKFMTTDILKDEYKFSSSGLYFAPKVPTCETGKLDTYKSYVESLPMYDDPELFGLHGNSSISLQQKETMDLISACVLIAPRTNSGGDSGGEGGDETSALATEIEGNLPDDFSKEDAGPTTFTLKNGLMDSLGTVLEQEMARYNNLLRVMRTTLRDLKRAIRGEMLMSATLDQVRFSLTTNIVPAIWTKNAYPSNKPLSSWVKDLYKKLDFISTWLKSGQPKIFWMAGFFFPQGFMTGALQTHSRKYRIPIDRLNYGFKVLDAYEDSDDLSAPDDGIFISGLYMDGARWDVDAHLIRDSHPGELLSLCPIIHFIPEVNHKLKDGLYECPVYKTSTRAGQLSTTGMSTNFVLAVEFPIDTDQSTWILRGAACLTQTDS